MSEQPGKADDRVVVVTPQGMGTAPGAGSGSGGGPDGAGEGGEVSPIELVEQPAKVMRIGSMIKQLLEEVRGAPLDEAGRTQLLVDAGLLVALSTFALCRLGLGIATAVPMLVLLPHLLRHAGAAPAWWTVLDSADPTATAVVTGLASVAALGVYTMAGPQRPVGLAGGAPE